MEQPFAIAVEKERVHERTSQQAGHRLSMEVHVFSFNLRFWEFLFLAFSKHLKCTILSSMNVSARIRDFLIFSNISIHVKRSEVRNGLDQNFCIIIFMKGFLRTVRRDSYAANLIGQPGRRLKNSLREGKAAKTKPAFPSKLPSFPPPSLFI